jgi:hypothetical protein
MLASIRLWFVEENFSMAKRSATHGKWWTAGEVASLKRLAKLGTMQAAANALRRTAPAVQQKAFRMGIMFRPKRRPSMKKAARRK